MRTIFKYTLPNEAIGGHCIIQMPADAVILKVAEQHGLITLWAEVIRNNPLEHRYFSIVGTGFDVPPDAKYVGTALCGNYVWHVYED